MKKTINTLIPSELYLPQLLGISSSATYLGLTQRCIRNLIYKRQIPFVHVGRRVFIRKVDLDSLVSQGTQK